MTAASKPASRDSAQELADLLEKLGAEVTEGPWAWDQRGDKINEWGLGVAFDRNEKPLSGRFTDEDAQYIEQVCQTEGATVNYADPDLICALRNNLPAIIAALRVRSEQQHRWIPVSERLPTEHRWYGILDADNEPRAGMYSPKNKAWIANVVEPIKAWCDFPPLPAERKDEH